MNRKQRRALMVGLVMAVFMVLFPPYEEQEWLIGGGVNFAPLWSPPSWNDVSDYSRLRGDILLEQLRLLTTLTVWAVLVSGSRMDSRRRMIHRVGMTVVAMLSTIAAAILLVPWAVFLLVVIGPKVWLSAPLNVAVLTVVLLLLPPRGGRQHWPRLP
jgi:hypothetical protein